MRRLGRVVAIAGAAAGACWAFGTRRWHRTTARLVARMRGAALPRELTVFRSADLDGLPAPVARYLRAVLPEGQPSIRVATLHQRGEFLIKPGAEGWRPFSAREIFTASPPGFVWDARIRMAPGLQALVRDSFIGGAGSMRASLLGLVSLVDERDTPEIAAGALDRYLAEAVWFPTALLPGRGVSWTAIDDRTAHATLTEASTTASLEFRFGADGLAASVYTPARYRDVGGRAVPTPWEGTFHRYESRSGIRIPVAAEVAWLLPEGRQPYWRGEIDAVEFDFQRP